MRSLSLALLLTAVSGFAIAASAPSPAPGAGDWPTMNHDAGATRFSPLTQITPANVSKLQVAWTYHMRPENWATGAALGGGRGGAPAAGPPGAGAPPAAGGGGGFPPGLRASYAMSEATPLVIKGVMYIGTPYNRVVALDPVTGVEKWVYELPNRDNPANRGIEYWPGSKGDAGRLVVATTSGKILQLDPATGKPVTSFGEAGYLNLKTPDVMGDTPNGYYSFSSPAKIWQDVILTGSRVQENPTKGAAGDVRAWDVRTGKMLWTFHTVPHPGEPGAETWAGDSNVRRSGANVWGQITVDDRRGIAYFPIGAPTDDRVGVDRAGDNLYGNSVVAIDIKTGKKVWHYQMVHHDIWDHDTSVGVVLIDVKKGGRTIPALATMNKSGILFLLDRTTGKPIYEIKETPVPPSKTPGEKASPTQPIPVSKEFILLRQSFDLSEVTKITPELNARCQKIIDDRKAVGSVMFEPLGFNIPNIRFPGYGGGPNWGGGAFDPKLGYYIINISIMGSIESTRQNADGTFSALTGLFRDQQTRSPCQTGPWGQLLGFDVNTGKVAWRTNFGVSDFLPPGQQDTGRPNVGGPIVTASGLIFIGATDDSRFHAYDTKTGKLLWETKIEAAAHATPVTYMGSDGRQYVTTVTTGGSTYLNSPVVSDNLVTYALPR